LCGGRKAQQWIILSRVSRKKCQNSKISRCEFCGRRKGITVGKNEQSFEEEMPKQFRNDHVFLRGCYQEDIKFVKQTKYVL
jgi:hypothetical protein